MSDFLSRDILPELWNEILRRHWSYLETEESILKLEERKKLEGCLKEFLCVVPHDRKFFLPETGHVLRKTVCELTNFNAQQAIVGFEAISQYANNLFTKPWRKEFRVLKTYSGSYQHEVESNLLDADKLFIAMGYRRIAEDTFVLEGPICPDQVTNVSRDAMAAYVECQIMKHIYAGLHTAGFSCSWQDIFHYRELYAGGTTQSIKGLAHRLHESQLRKEQQQRQQHTENTYSNVSSSREQDKSGCALHGQLLHGVNNCALRATNGHVPAPPTNLNCLYQQQQQQQQVAPNLMTHSRSLEHYQEPLGSLPQRHSFDQQPKHCQQHPHAQLYETPYDCLDGLSLGGGSSASYAAVAGAYNAPGNRYPLPYNISSQLNAQYATPLDGYPNPEHNMYASIGKSTVPHSCGYGRALPAALQHRQSTYPPDQQHLIDFDERAQLMQHDFNDPRYYERRGQRAPAAKLSGIYAQPMVDTGYAPGYEMPSNLPATLPQPPPQDMYVYARPVPKSSRQRTAPEAARPELLDSLDNNRHKPTHKELTADGRRDICDAISYESPSLDDFPALSSASPPTPINAKVQDGVGSFESWNYVFKNLERSGYSKDLGDREDLLVQSLDLESLNLANGGGATAERHTQSANVDKARTLEKKRETREPRESRDSRVVQAPAPKPVPNASSSVGVKKVKSALKSASVDSRATGSRGSRGAIAKQPPPVSTQLIVTSPNEWSCRFCTFLNPDTKRICEMCCRSKDFNPEAAANVSHASSTCV
ncbi:tamo [Drosophila busckii]|uniref:Tamo n=1 Tax=Drosophila busckii TaxID=30019 RepID=A0A0M5IX17_DROBS|nr:protein tamozhennic [Drosophila busckii]XP_017838255.1 protein tamozhennic [Drosophila busckii]ALC40548.1 tamo [Drosophila busckii]